MKKATNWLAGNMDWLSAVLITLIFGFALIAQDAKVWKLSDEQIKEGEKLEGQAIAMEQVLQQTINAGLQANVDAQSALIAQSQLKIAFLNRELAKLQKAYWELKTVQDHVCKDCGELAVDLKAKQLRRQPKPEAVKRE